MDDMHKSLRVFLGHDLSEGVTLIIGDPVHHYLKNVMRVPEGSHIRVFNARDGEFCARVERLDKKIVEATIENKLRPQKNPKTKIHLLFPPLKKERMDFLIEKAVELGATDFHPVLTQNTDMRKINDERVTAQIVEASEQCERLDIPTLHSLTDLSKKLAAWDSSIPVFAAIERTNAQSLTKQNGSCALLVGPPGGFSLEEKNHLTANYPFVQAVSLGENILREETAAITGLTLLTL